MHQCWTCTRDCKIYDPDLISCKQYAGGEDLVRKVGKSAGKSRAQEVTNKA